MSVFVGVVDKDKDDVFTWTHDWSPYMLSGETVSSVSYTTQSGLTQDATSNTTTTSSVRVSAGTAGEVYKVEMQATFSNSDKASVHRLFRITNN